MEHQTKATAKALLYGTSTTSSVFSLFYGSKSVVHHASIVFLFSSWNCALSGSWFQIHPFICSSGGHSLLLGEISSQWRAHYSCTVSDGFIALWTSWGLARALIVGKDHDGKMVDNQSHAFQGHGPKERGYFSPARVSTWRTWTDAYYMRR